MVCKKCGPSADCGKARVSIKCCDLMVQSTGQCDVVGIQTGDILAVALSPPVFKRGNQTLFRLVQCPQFWMRRECLNCTINAAVVNQHDFIVITAPR
jgi:hypothetical protein